MCVYIYIYIYIYDISSLRVNTLPANHQFIRGEWACVSLGKMNRLDDVVKENFSVSPTVVQKRMLSWLK